MVHPLSQHASYILLWPPNLSFPTTSSPSRLGWPMNAVNVTRFHHLSTPKPLFDMNINSKRTNRRWAREGTHRSRLVLEYEAVRVVLGVEDMRD